MKIILLTVILCSVALLPLHAEEPPEYVEEEIELYVDNREEVSDSQMSNRKALIKGAGPIHAINFNLIGATIGNISLNYECNFNATQSVFVEGFYRPVKEEKFYGVGVHYRHHIHRRSNHKRLNSPFWAVHLRHSQIYVGITEKLGDDIVDEDLAKIVINTVGANFGRRWVMGKHFNIIARVGYGIPFVTYHFYESDLIDQKEDEGRAFVAIAGVDAEFSMGFIF